MPTSQLRSLKVTQVRNLRQVAVEPLGPVNVFYGVNGSGKTSVLEAIHLLGMARSFRGNPRSLITHGQQSCTVFGQFSPPATAVGVQRDSQGNVQIKLGGEPVRAVSSLAEFLPLQVINADSFNLLGGPPAGRRRYLDWGVFHVEQSFYPQWRRYQRGLKQRNMLLRRGKIDESQLAVWTREVCQHGEAITLLREAYFERLNQQFTSYLELLAPELAPVELRFRRGWDSKMDFSAALEAALASDREQGFTHVGPQRADIKVAIDGQAAAEVLSRGQIKMVVCALKLAQGAIMAQASPRNCVYLVDDLPSELDAEHTRLVCSALAGLERTQVFITCVDASSVLAAWPGDRRQALNVFHVEQGTLRNVGYNGP